VCESRLVPSDLTDIRTYIAERNSAAAERLRRRIAQTIDLLADFPYIGRAAGKPGVLMTVVPRYRYKIFYSATGDWLDILHVRHPARSDPAPHQL
jgi:toxin ParE1/3/4